MALAALALVVFGAYDSYLSLMPCFMPLSCSRLGDEGQNPRERSLDLKVGSPIPVSGMKIEQRREHNFAIFERNHINKELSTRPFH